MLRPYIGLIAHLLLGFLHPPSANQGWDEAPSRPPSGQGDGPSTMALAAAGLSIASWVFLPLIGAIAGMIVGRSELSKIEKGQSPEKGRVFAQLGWWVGLANVIASILGGCIALAFWFGFVALLFGGAAMSEGAVQ